jgi:hypothetical protein
MGKFKITTSDINRFTSFVVKTDGCWLWISAKNSKGYGSFWLDSKTRPAHHVAFVLWNGKITAGMMVLHTCDNPSCVNPAHLYLGDNAQNMRDMWSRKRREGRKPDCHPERKHAGNGMCVACYKQFRRGPRFCVVCNKLLPRFKAKTCSEECFHNRAMELQRVRRAAS